MKELKWYAIISAFLLLLAIIAAKASIERNNGVIEPNNVPDRYLVVEHKWERALTNNCRYQFRIEGFAPVHRDDDRLRRIVLIDDCDAYEKGDTLAITKL